MKTNLLKVLLFSSFLLTGCQKEIVKVPLYYKDASLTTIIEFSELSLLEELIEEEENFILVSYADYTCSCWGSFRDQVLTPYIRDHKVPIYAIFSDLLDGDLRGLPINSKSSNTPVVGVYEKGVYKYGISYKQDSSVFTQRVDFERWVDTYVTLPLMTRVTIDQLNVLLKGTTPFIIDWYYMRCPDCQALDYIYVPSYLKEKKVSAKLPFYVIETHPLRAVTSEWVNIKNVYGLSSVNNTVYGYSVGYVPTLQVITPNGHDYVADGNISPIISDMMVFQNETVSKVGNDFVVTDSYFNGVRGQKYLGNYNSEIGKVVDADAVMTSTSSSSGYAFKPLARYDVHIQYAEQFLDHYWL